MLGNVAAQKRNASANEITIYIHTYVYVCACVFMPVCMYTY